MFLLGTLFLSSLLPTWTLVWPVSPVGCHFVKASPLLSTWPAQELPALITLLVTVPSKALTTLEPPTLHSHTPTAAHISGPCDFVFESHSPLKRTGFLEEIAHARNRAEKIQNKLGCLESRDPVSFTVTSSAFSVCLAEKLV